MSTGDEQGIHLIDERLYLGSAYAAVETDNLKQLGVTHVVTVIEGTNAVVPALQKAGLIVLHVDAPDAPEYMLLPAHLDGVVAFISNAQGNGGTVFVHCMAGVSRSATFVIAYLMRTKRWRMQKALTHVKERRPIVAPNPGFRAQLVTLEAELFPKKRGCVVM
eukprot:GDKI01014660.1.p1 GENE.GDKI01014660.1~~GDKI01014660.1.p1  ORF type:complete len:163 (-),score=58.25 GDKI01014660.1:427-915(-)